MTALPCDLCWDCNGAGVYPSGDRCKSCGGTGLVPAGEGVPQRPTGRARDKAAARAARKTPDSDRRG
jgi:DnaJ-class molecular chaperone